MKHLLSQVEGSKWASKKEEVSIVKGFIKKYETEPEKMYVEDLSALEKLTEETIIEELKHRMEKGFSYTFVGDVLLAINSNDMPKQFPKSVSIYWPNCSKVFCARSEKKFQRLLESE